MVEPGHDPAREPVGQAADEGRVLAPGEFTLLLELLDRGLHQRPLEGAFKVEVETEGVRLVLASSDRTTRVTTTAGTLTLRGLGLEVLRP